MMKAIFAGNPETTVIVAYSPTNMATNDARVDNFYDNLSKAIDKTPPHHFLTVLLLGDMNAKISSEHVKFANNQKPNRNAMVKRYLNYPKKSTCV